MPTKKLFKLYLFSLTALLLTALFTVPAYATEDMWTAANRIIVDVYTHIAGISTVLAGLMSAVAVIGAKLSNNQHKVDQAWDWLKRIWIAWAVINGIGAFIAYIAPLFSGLATINPWGTETAYQWACKRQRGSGCQRRARSPGREPARHRRRGRSISACPT